MNALEFMTRFEGDCLAFYETLGSDAQNPELKELYELLADTQKRHLDKLAELRNNTSGNEAESVLLERADHLVNGCRRLLFNYDITKEMKNDRDAFDHVVHAEEDIIRLFEGMAREESSDNARKMLATIAASEKGHLEEIEGIYEFIEAPHCYLEWGEFSNLHPL